ncbi:FAD-binding protein [Rhodovulum imhoffii]|nr:FAD-binding protein [Rhodovulum imhoffii]MBK5933531.1 2-hydroxy-acid oxidase [Rhodovulum imhoffii]
MTPADEAELCAMVAGAQAPLRVVGGGTRSFGKGERLSLSALRGVEVYEPGALTLVARAGTPVVEVEALLAAEGQRLAFEPMDHRSLLGTTGEPTLGGMVAANVSGPRRVQAGACRDALLGVRFVDGRGQVLRNGGRVMKNVTGYDLVKLMAGSRGMLGALTEVSLKVLPGVETAVTLILHGLDDRRAVAAMAAALGSPFEVTGAAHLPARAGGPLTLLRLEGFSDSVCYRAGRLEALLSAFGEIEVEQGDARWADLRDVRLFAGSGRDVWRIVVKATEAPGLVARLPEGARAFYDWGGGLVWAELPAGTDLSALGPFAGHARQVRGSGCGLSAHPPAIAALTAALRAQFDPRGIFICDPA